MRKKLLLLAAGLHLASASTAGAVVVTAVGDVMLGGSAAPTLKKKGHAHAFEGTERLLRGGDITVGNLEAPITGRGTKFNGKRFCFRTASSAAGALQKAGFRVMTLANNHIMDYGADGLADTKKFLQVRFIASTGAGATLREAREPAVVEARGEKVAFLAYSLTQPVEFFAGAAKAGTAPGFAPFFTRDIARARLTADHVVVSFHWGDEGSGVPRTRQTEAARAAIDAGASAVIGHHPHVLQGIEFYRGAPILYSLGNFTFGSRSRTARTSMIARIILEKGQAGVEIVPINVLNSEVDFRPVPLAGTRREQALREIRALSLPFGTRFVSSDNRILAVPGEVADGLPPVRRN
ncbi:MAG TPA: CapA family protein [Verrucomicrobiae bacterium]|nr:CapA family protein [Verrucomicrobiae bacterium]